MPDPLATTSLSDEDFSPFWLAKEIEDAERQLARTQARLAALRARLTQSSGSSFDHPVNDSQRQ